MSETCVVSVSMKELRRLYGNKYLNQSEWAKDPNNVYIGRAGSVFINGSRWPSRASPFHNPFTVAKYGRDGALDLYREYILDKLQDPQMMTAFRELKGKTLGCWCKPDRCHGDILVELLKKIII